MVIAATIGGYSINIDPNNDSTEPTNTKRVYKITNASGANIFIEGKETSTGTSLVLDAEDDDIGDLVNLLDSNKNGIIESNEAQNGGIQRIDGISLIDNHAYRSQVTQNTKPAGFASNGHHRKKLFSATPKVARLILPTISFR